jgi:ketosteroid isomerase-like protein
MRRARREGYPAKAIGTPPWHEAIRTLRGVTDDAHRVSDEAARAPSARAADDPEVELVRGGYEAFETMDMEQFTAGWAPDVLWDVSAYEDWPGSKRCYRGAAEILAEFGSFMSTVRSLRIDVHEVTRVGDRVLSLYTEYRRDEGQTDETVLEIGIVHEFEGGQITRMDVHTGHENARKAVGLD